MAEQVVTDFVINLTQYDAQIAKATEGMAGFDKEVTDVNKLQALFNGRRAEGRRFSARLSYAAKVLA